MLDDLGSTLEELSRRGAAAIYGGPLGREILRHLRAEGGTLDGSRPRRLPRDPAAAGARARSAATSSSPIRRRRPAGVLIGYGLRLLDALGPSAAAGSADAIAALAEVMREQGRARAAGFTRDLYRGGLAARLYSADNVRAALKRIRAGLEGRPETAERGTTQISVVDAHGNAASMTASTGSGSGVIVPGTGIHMNNMLGEYDLNPGGDTARPASG